MPVNLDPAPVTLAADSFAHLMLGLMKADGVVTEAEGRKVQILARKYDGNLPCPADALANTLLELQDSHLHRVWKPEDHLKTGLDQYNAFALSGEATSDHARICFEMLELLAEVDGLTRAEELYLEHVRKDFVARYGELALL